MVKTLDERHVESERDSKLPPCDTEAELRKAAESGEAEPLIALATALINNSIEHQDPDEALCCLEKARGAAGPGAATLLERIVEIEAQAKKKQHELGEALQLEIMHNQDA